MSWNYRVVKRKHFGDACVTFAIHEVYYHDDGTPRAVTSEPTWPLSGTVEGLLEVFNLYKKAFDKPVLDYELDNDNKPAN